MRILEPMTLDFPALADGVRRNNVGVAGITVHVRARIERADAAGDGGRDGDGQDGHVVVFEPGGQRLPLDGPAPDDGAAGWRAFDVRGWDPPGSVRLVLRGD